MRGRNRNKGPNPLTRTYESNGPDVKIRGTAQHIADKYTQLARDAQASGDPVAAENYLQHAEHYYRIIAAAQEQFRDQFGGFQRPFDEEGDDDAQGFGYGQAERVAASGGQDEADFGSQPQPYEARGEQGERPARFERPDRQDRGDRRERFQRPDRPPRQDFQRPDGQRQEHPPGEFRQEQRPEQPRLERRERRAEDEEVGSSGLPAFLTNPVRAPTAAAESAEEGVPPEGANGEAREAPNGEGNGRYRQRRRRRPRYEGAAGERTAPDGADFAPEPSPAE